MSRTSVLARQDLRLTLRDRSSIFWIFIAPFLWVSFFGLVSRSPDPSQIRIGLTVVQQDDSEAADRFIEYLRAENFASTVTDTVPPEEKMPPRFVRIPAGFGAAIEAREKVQVEVRSRPQASDEATFAAQVALHKAIVRLLAAEAFGGMEPEDDAVRIRSEWGGGRAIPSGYYQTIPGNLVMFVLLSTMTYGTGLLAAERSRGLLRRLAATSLTREAIIAGKLFGRVAIASLQVAVFIFIGVAVFRIDWGESPAGLVLLMVPYIFTAAALGLLTGALFTKPEAAAGAGVVVTLVMSALGGCWWPAEVMPDWLRTTAYIFPTAWAMNGLHEVISWGGRASDVAVHGAVLALFAIAAGFGAARLLRTG